MQTISPKRKRHIKKLAKKQLDRYKNKYGNFDVFQACKDSNIEIMQYTYKKGQEEDIYGFYDAKLNTINVLAELEADSRNFILTHEYGHYLLDHMKDKDKSKFLEYFKMFYTNNIEEQEANLFALLVLLPRNNFDKALEFTNLNYDMMSKIFNVPTAVIKHRFIDIHG